jgi:hypothetical protein
MGNFLLYLQAAAAIATVVGRVFKPDLPSDYEQKVGDLSVDIGSLVNGIGDLISHFKKPKST